MSVTDALQFHRRARRRHAFPFGDVGGAKRLQVDGIRARGASRGKQRELIEISGSRIVFLDERRGEGRAVEIHGAVAAFDASGGDE